MITITNKTRYPQDVHTSDGQTITVGAESSADVDEKNLFPEELDRVKKFFAVIEKESAKAGTTRKKFYESENGGTE